MYKGKVVNHIVKVDTCFKLYNSLRTDVQTVFIFKMMHIPSLPTKSYHKSPTIIFSTLKCVVE